MAIEWNPNFKYQPMAGFPAPMQIPSYSDVKTKKSDQSKFPSFKGIDFQTGKQVDLADYYKSPVFGIDQDNKPEEPTSAYPAGSPTEGLTQLAEQIAAIEAARDPILANRYRTFAQIASEQQLQQMSALMPLQRYAGDIAEQRAIRAGVFRQQSPENVQNIMASKQSQMASAAAGEAARAQAMADQQRAASLYGGPFAGQFVRFGVG
jgi:hypothetical protein